MFFFIVQMSSLSKVSNIIFFMLLVEINAKLDGLYLNVFTSTFFVLTYFCDVPQQTLLFLNKIFRKHEKLDKLFASY